MPLTIKSQRFLKWLSVLATVPSGRVITMILQEMGKHQGGQSSRSGRRNPLPIIPCHRIVQANGKVNPRGGNGANPGLKNIRKTMAYDLESKRITD